MSSFAGSFLVARPILKEPTFRRTVVLLLQHGEEGAFGLVVNRPAEVEGLPFPVYAGGPCPSEGLFLLHGHTEWAKKLPQEGGGEVAPGILLGDASCLARISDPVSGQALRFRMFSGYAGWGPNQLEGELAVGAWALTPANGELLFDTPAGDLWEHLAPPTIPQPSVN